MRRVWHESFSIVCTRTRFFLDRCRDGRLPGATTLSCTVVKGRSRSPVLGSFGPPPLHTQGWSDGTQETRSGRRIGSQNGTSQAWVPQLCLSFLSLVASRASLRQVSSIATACTSSIAKSKGLSVLHSCTHVRKFLNLSCDQTSKITSRI